MQKPRIIGRHTMAANSMRLDSPLIEVCIKYRKRIYGFPYVKMRIIAKDNIYSLMTVYFYAESIKFTGIKAGDRIHIFRSEKKDFYMCVDNSVGGLKVSSHSRNLLSFSSAFLWRSGMLEGNYTVSGPYQKEGDDKLYYKFDMVDLVEKVIINKQDEKDNLRQQHRVYISEREDD